MRYAILAGFILLSLGAGAQEKILKIHLKPGYTAFFAVSKVDSVTYGSVLKVHRSNNSIASFTTTEVDRVTYVNDTEIVMDIDDNVYPTVVIGTQVWMAENLRTTKYRDGSNIPLVTDNTQWANNWNNGNSLQQPMMCWYNNDQVTYTANKFGALYNWYTINPATNGNKNVCPIGWHVPTDAEWTTLTTYLGGETVAGGKMKSTGTEYWYIPNRDATNSSGFSCLPGGIRIHDGTFNENIISGSWWSSTEFRVEYAWSRLLTFSSGVIYRDDNAKINGYSVRCLKD